MVQRKTVRRRRRQRRRRSEMRGGGNDVPRDPNGNEYNDVPRDPNGNEYKIYFANPISNWSWFGLYSETIQFETPKFNVLYKGNTALRPIKIGDNYAYKFFYLRSTADQKWYVMLNFQINKNHQDSKQGNGEIYGIPLDAMGPNQNIETNSNNYITLEFLPSIVVPSDAKDDDLILDFQKLQNIDESKDTIVSYLQTNTLVKDMGKESVNGASLSIWESFFGI